MIVSEFIEYLKTQDQTAEVRILALQTITFQGSIHEFEAFNPIEHAFAWDRDGKAYIDLGSDT